MACWTADSVIITILMEGTMRSARQYAEEFSHLNTGLVSVPVLGGIGVPLPSGSQASTTLADELGAALL